MCVHDVAYEYSMVSNETSERMQGGAFGVLTSIRSASGVLGSLIPVLLALFVPVCEKKQQDLSVCYAFGERLQTDECGSYQ